MSIIQRFKKLSFVNALWMLIAAVALIVPQAQVKKAEAQGDCVINLTGSPSILVSAYGYNAGQTGMLAWITTGCSYLELIGPTQEIGFGTMVAEDGQVDVGPFTFDYPYTKTYTMSGIGDNGQIFASFTFYLTQTIPVCDITGFNASSTTIDLGQSVNFTWTSTNCTSLNISDGTNTYSVTVPNGSATYTPAVSGTTTYIIRDGNGGTSSLSRTILVNDPNAAPACTFTSFGPDPNYIDAFGNASVTWATSGDGCNVSLSVTSVLGAIYYHQGEANFGTKTISGVQAGDVWELAYGSGQRASIVMRVRDDCGISSFTASPSTFSSPGAAVTLTWSAGWCTSVTLRGGEFGSGTNVSGYGTSYGSIVAHPTNTTTYYIEAFNSHNQALGRNATATLSGPTCRLSIGKRINGGLLSVTTPLTYYNTGAQSLSGEMDNQTVSCGGYALLGFPSQMDTGLKDSDNNSIYANLKSSTSISFDLNSVNTNQSVIVEYQTPAKIEVK